MKGLISIAYKVQIKLGVKSMDYVSAWFVFAWSVWELKV